MDERSKVRQRGRLCRGQGWSCSLLRQHKSAQQVLLSNPWTRPLLAYNLAAASVQKVVRGYIARERIKRKNEAAKTKRLSSSSKRRSRTISTQLRRYVKHPHSQQILGYTDWCATRLAAWWRAQKPRYHYTLLRHRIYTMAALEIQLGWRHYKSKRQRSLLTNSIAEAEQESSEQSQQQQEQEERPEQGSDDEKGKVGVEEIAVRMIQKAWRRHVNVRIFKYYKDLIRFQWCCDPALLLKHISPSEADLSVRDAAIGIHVRFRLGGASFPPVLMFKVFTHNPVCDINAFGPRNYSLEKRLGLDGTTLPFLKEKSRSKQKKEKNLGYLRVGRSHFKAIIKESEEHSINGIDNTNEWYHRVENNGWRHVGGASALGRNNQLAEDEAVDDEGEYLTRSLSSSLTSRRRQQQPFQFSRTNRKEDLMQRRHQAKRRWINQIHETVSASSMTSASIASSSSSSSLLSSSEFSKCVNFDEYLNEWYSIGTSSCSGRVK